MDSTAARRKGELPDDARASEPMRPQMRGEIARNPSSDQRRARRSLQRRRTATRFDTEAWRLNPGDNIQMPNGMTQQVVRVRQHENSPQHVYVDSDGGTALVRRTDPFTIVPANSQQQSMPGYGIPGGNSNTLPWDRGHSPAGPQNCNHCGRGRMIRRGDHFVCSQCHRTQQYGGAGGYSFGPDSQIITTFSTVNQPLTNAVSGRARLLLETITKENHQ